MLRHIIFALSVLTISQMPMAKSSFAEGMQDQAYMAKLLELNKIRPEQSPNFVLGDTQLKGRVIDKNQRTMGRVNNIIVGPDGKYQTILTRTEESGFREEVAIDVATYISNQTPNTFTVSLDRDQLKNNMARLLAATSTAAGEDSPLTIANLQRGTIYKTGRKPVAGVSDVLVDAKNMQIVALIVKMTSGQNQRDPIAIPYEAMSVKRNGDKLELTITDAQADMIASMATR